MTHRPLAIGLALSAAVTFQPAPVAASPVASAVAARTRPSALPNGDCAWGPRPTPYHWTQDACLYDSIFGDGLQSVVTIELQPGFRRDHVKQCRIRMRLTSSYGSVHWGHIDCTGEMRGGQDTTINGYWNWGSGRRSGDRYTLEAWAEVTTGVTTYTGRPTAATSTTVKR